MQGVFGSLKYVYKLYRQSPSTRMMWAYMSGPHEIVGCTFKMKTSKCHNDIHLVLKRVDTECIHISKKKIKYAHSESLVQW